MRQIKQLFVSSYDNVIIAINVALFIMALGAYINPGQYKYPGDMVFIFWEFSFVSILLKAIRSKKWENYVLPGILYFFIPMMIVFPFYIKFPHSEVGWAIPIIAFSIMMVLSMMIEDWEIELSGKNKT